MVAIVMIIMMMVMVMAIMIHNYDEEEDGFEEHLVMKRSPCCGGEMIV